MRTLAKRRDEVRKNRITIEQTTCRRCGKPLATTSRSLFGLDRLKARLGSICSDCMTEDEKQEMLEAMGDSIISASTK